LNAGFSHYSLPTLLAARSERQLFVSSYLRMTSASRRRIVDLVKTPSRSSRVLITVAPPLLGDLLATRLAAADREVVVAEPAARLGDATTFDVIVTDRLAFGFHADAVLSLPHSDQPGWGSLRRDNRIERVPLGTLGQIVAVVDRICAQRGAQLHVVG
jgi:hypothetical protein